uniref:Uncharacterized protein n=1 Tax=Arundo donax TaxID=35708 RepID=A0A0A9E6E2_ARUDO
MKRQLAIYMIYFYAKRAILSKFLCRMGLTNYKILMRK